MKKVEIEIPDGWELDTSTYYPERVGRGEMDSRFLVPFRKADTREPWQKEIDEYNAANGSTGTEPIVFGRRFIAIPRNCTPHHRNGWTVYLAQPAQRPIPAWVTETPYLDGYDWRLQHAHKCIQARVLLRKAFDGGRWSADWPNYETIVGPGEPDLSKRIDERYHYENGQWVHRPWGSVTGEEV